LIAGEDVKGKRGARPRHYDYDVCLSFAGEDRAYVEEPLEVLLRLGARDELLRFFAPLRVCDFFQFGRKGALITKELRALKRPKIEKSHGLSE
jgi:hypothetical protein